MDKAGAYGVQDVMGLIGVSALSGSFYTVMGMPTHRLHELLAGRVEMTLGSSVNGLKLNFFLGLKTGMNAWF